jgi:hypothetical protein
MTQSPLHDDLVIAPPRSAEQLRKAAVELQGKRKRELEPAMTRTVPGEHISEDFK